MMTNIAGAAASCTTGTWAQQFKCGWNQPVSPAVPNAGYTFGHSGLPALAVLVVILLVRSVRRRRKGRSPAPAGAAARR